MWKGPTCDISCGRKAKAAVKGAWGGLERVQVLMESADPFSIAHASMVASMVATQVRSSDVTQACSSSSHATPPLSESASRQPPPPLPFTVLPSAAFSVSLHSCSEWPSPRIADPHIRRPAPGSRNVVRVRAAGDAPLEPRESA